MKELSTEQVLSAYQRLFNTPDGKVVLQDLKRCYFDQTAKVLGHVDETMYKLGQKELVQGLLSLVTDEEEFKLKLKQIEE